MRNYYCENKKLLSYDYENQVWIKDGKYQDCGHSSEMQCNCFGRKHKNEFAVISKDCQ